jgi:hypothetical protein
VAVTAVVASDGLVVVTATVVTDGSAVVDGEVPLVGSALVPAVGGIALFVVSEVGGPAVRPWLPLQAAAARQPMSNPATMDLLNGPPPGSV